MNDRIVAFNLPQGLNKPELNKVLSVAGGTTLTNSVGTKGYPNSVDIGVATGVDLAWHLVRQLHAV